MGHRNSGSGIVWFLAGLGMGVAAGILFAPQAGSETREVLRSKADEGREYVRDRARDVREQASDWVDRGKDVISQQKEQIRSAVQAGKQAYRETTSAVADVSAKTS